MLALTFFFKSETEKHLNDVVSQSSGGLAKSLTRSLLNCCEFPSDETDDSSYLATPPSYCLCSSSTPPQDPPSKSNQFNKLNQSQTVNQQLKQTKINCIEGFRVLPI
ncbi:hypothetical protein HanPSC8_Chr09g0377011 [Helianthus annuus]|nr:hypothetical protein HanPSC8_Chr09g0377011 [Helianthus annuus]